MAKEQSNTQITIIDWPTKEKEKERKGKKMSVVLASLVYSGAHCVQPIARRMHEYQESNMNVPLNRK